MTLREIECNQCGEFFETEKSIRVYCSRECKQKARRARDEGDQGHEWRACRAPQCTEVFFAKRKDSRYCSERCGRRARSALRQRKTPLERKCRCCGRVFTPKKNQVLCSAECRTESRRRPRPPERPCDRCQTIFGPRQPNQRFCSVTCQEEDHLESSRRRYAEDAEHRKHRLAMAAEYRAQSRRALNLYSKTYRDANREVLIAKSQAYYEANRERLKQASREYYAAKKDKIVEATRKRREKQRAQSS